MASLQIRDMPDDVYEALAQRAQRERRSLAQQAIADLARTDEMEARTQRQAAIDKLRRTLRPKGRKLSDPVTMIRSDRQR